MSVLEVWFQAGGASVSASNTSVGVYLAGSEVGQAGEIKGALFELRRVKGSKSFAELFDRFGLCLQGVEIYLGWPRAGSGAIQL